MTGILWLASYPKSGNTWLRAVLTAARSGADVDLDALAGAAVAASRDVLEDLLGVPTTDLTSAEIDRLRPGADDVAAAAARSEPLLRKIHDAFGAEPVISVAAAHAAVYLVRDPRDVAVSMAHHSGVSFEEAVRRLCVPHATAPLHPARPGKQVRQYFGTWSEHVLGWVDQRRFPVYVLRYEDALADPVPAFAPAVRLAGFDLTDEALAAAVRRADFAVLADLESRSGFRERPPHAERFFRRGRAGGWRDELPAALAERIVDRHGEVMTRFGYL
ncbi:sulfotransferase [Virgisporangium aliadipatigenens]|uniref:Sulfotransferase n=1 Tax=Virgisporangium aliadipatigenens TaxID=741659 RepID=A0A8J3YXZ8_9ACTN|nr:sulfotransferase domain-containing protein [Virgisporangium aliadipatigenens]GIJ51756.1 sulfotransferase [Virgisporangium aliadipatigenens]